MRTIIIKGDTGHPNNFFLKNHPQKISFMIHKMEMMVVRHRDDTYRALDRGLSGSYIHDHCHFNMGLYPPIFVSMNKKKPEIIPLPNTPSIPTRNPEIMPLPEKNNPIPPAPEIRPDRNPEIRPGKERAAKEN